MNKKKWPAPLDLLACVLAVGVGMAAAFALFTFGVGLMVIVALENLL